MEEDISQNSSLKPHSILTMSSGLDTGAPAVANHPKGIKIVKTFSDGTKVFSFMKKFIKQTKDPSLRLIRVTGMQSIPS